MSDPVILINNQKEDPTSTIIEIKESYTESVFPQKKQSNYSNSLEPQEDPQFVLSNSDLEIGNFIEEQINQSQRNTIPMSGFLPNPLPQSEQTSEKSEEKDIRMTTSQLLNEKGEVIVPFYKTKFFIFIVLVILLLISGGTFLATDGENRKKIKKGKETQKKKQKNQNNKQKTRRGRK